MDMKWYIVYTKPGSEKKVSEILTRKRFENYSPVYVVSQRWSNNKRVDETPLFKGYVFVRSSKEQHDELKKINQIINFVYWMGEPVSIKNIEVKAIKLFLREYKNINIEKTTIKNNSINRNEDRNVEQEVPLITIKNKKAYFGLPSLGFMLTAEVEAPNVRIISTESSSNSKHIKENTLFNRVVELNNSLKNYWVKTFVLSICIVLIIR